MDKKKQLNRLKTFLKKRFTKELPRTEKNAQHIKHLRTS